jgi:hypothetical protein
LRERRSEKDERNGDLEGSGSSFMVVLVETSFIVVFLMAKKRLPTIVHFKPKSQVMIDLADAGRHLAVIHKKESAKGRVGELMCKAIINVARELFEWLVSAVVC